MFKRCYTNYLNYLDAGGVKGMKRPMLVSLLLTVVLVLPQVVFAESLEDKIKILEERQAELYHSLKEKKEFDFVGNISDKISLGGLIEVEAAFVDNERDAPNEDSSDITLATVELGIDAKVNEHVEGHILFLYEEDETDFDVDEGTITITSPYGLYLAAGKMYVPFGAFNSHFITDPLTLDLGETNESAVLLGRGDDLYEFAVGIFNGDVDDSADDEIDDFVASLTVTPSEGLSFGASYISDIADSDSEIAGGGIISDSVAGIGLFLSSSFGPFTVEAEYVGAIDDFAAAEVGPPNSLTGSEPSAYNVELAYAVSEDIEAALRLEGSDDLNWVEDRVGVAASFGIYENTTISLEYLHGEYQNNQEVDSITAQLALEF
jgi:hypothetical protein